MHSLGVVHPNWLSSGQLVEVLPEIKSSLQDMDMHLKAYDAALLS